MTQRLNAYAIVPDAFTAKGALDTYLNACGLEHSLIHLLKVRVSQINHCAYCLHMHREEALKDGDTEKRLLLLDAWRESTMFTDKEKAALAWADSVTKIADTHAPDADFDGLKAHFSDKEICDLTFAIAQINGWNRVAASLRLTHPQDRVR
jgi:AhpD family alkylhydroperoxidase